MPIPAEQRRSYGGDGCGHDRRRPGSSWVSAVATVDITNVPLPVRRRRSSTSATIPSTSTARGWALAAPSPRRYPTRSYYYHSDIGLPHDLDVVLTATKPSRVHVMQSAAGPDLDVMSVGHTGHRLAALSDAARGVIANIVPSIPYVLVTI